MDNDISNSAEAISADSDDGREWGDWLPRNAGGVAQTSSKASYDASYETLALVRAYWRLRNPRTRHRLLGIAERMSASEGK